MPTTDQLIERALRPGVVYAVVGASRFPVKSGYKIYAYLRKNGLRAYPVNPLADTIMNDRAYPDLKALPQRPDVVNIVVPPDTALEVVKQAHRLCVPIIWLQPGSNSPAIDSYATEHNLMLIKNTCLMTELYRHHLSLKKYPPRQHV